MTKNVKTVNKNFYLISVLTPIIKSESEKIDETGRNSVLGKVLSFVEGKVEASAGRCSNQYSIWGKNWWGITRNIYTIKLRYIFSNLCFIFLLRI